jgi:endo-1,4-beta-xylanase
LTHVTPAPGVFIGFDFQVNNDEDGNGSRDSVAIWNDPTGQSYQNTSRIGVLQFVAAPTPPHIYLPLVMRVAP